MLQILLRSCLFAGLLAIAPALAMSASAQSVGTLAGTVTLDLNGEPVHGAVVLVVGPGAFALTDQDGRFEIASVPVGTHEVLAQREHLSAVRLTVTVGSGATTEVDFQLSISPVHEEITVTASAIGAATTFEAFNSVISLDSFELAKRASGSIAEALEDEPGIATRSFGAGSGRPIIRGFDGDRVLIMEDGVRTGDLSAQSGDHGVSIDAQSLERLEVVKGPATLLYGSNAVGGVVNAITPHDSYKTSPLTGVRGSLTTDFGSANAQAGGNGSFQYGNGRWMLWGGGGGRRTGDYDTPEGQVENSKTRGANGNIGVGYFGRRAFSSFGYRLEDGTYGVPFAGDLHGHSDEEEHAEEEHAEEEELFIDLDQRRQVGRFDFGMRELGNGVVESFRTTVNYIDWTHDEIERVGGVSAVGTSFDNRTLVLRAELTQRQRGRLSGTFGVWAQYRDYAASGEEALSPPTTQNGVAAFAYEELDFGRVRVQFGGRLEHNDYEPQERAGGDHGPEEAVALDGLTPPDPIARSFTGFSGSAGAHLSLTDDWAVVGNISRSSRAPALEELYNFGPHVGNLAFEIGNTRLDSETTTGFDLSLRAKATRTKGELNVYYYDINDFVFPSFTGEIADGLRVAEFLQGDSRFVGADASTSVSLHEHLWLNAGLGWVDAELTETDEPLPRIPAFHAKIGIEIPYRELTIGPEIVVTARQGRVFRDETPTDGSAVFNLGGSYVLARQHLAHVITVQGFNLTNESYRLHTSFIKDLALQIGRGVRVSYSLRYF